MLGHFDEEEANHGAVALEETPGCFKIRDYNREKAAGDSAMAEVSEAAIPYGSVGSSHIKSSGISFSRPTVTLCLKL